MAILSILILFLFVCGILILLQSSLNIVRFCSIIHVTLTDSEFSAKRRKKTEQHWDSCITELLNLFFFNSLPICSVGMCIQANVWRNADVYCLKLYSFSALSPLSCLPVFCLLWSVVFSHESNFCLQHLRVYAYLSVCCPLGVRCWPTSVSCAECHGKSLQIWLLMQVVSYCKLCAH